MPSNLTLCHSTGKSLSDQWAWNTTATAKAAYDIHLHGSNGFVRMFKGVNPVLNDVAVLASYDTDKPALLLSLSSPVGYPGLSYPLGTAGATYTIKDNAYGAATAFVVVPEGHSETHVVSVNASGNWYDVTVSVIATFPNVTGTSLFERRFMGHIETGATTTSDPAMSKGVPALGHETVAEIVRDNRLGVGIHPPVPDAFLALSRTTWGKDHMEQQCASERSKFKSACKDHCPDLQPEFMQYK